MSDRMGPQDSAVPALVPLRRARRRISVVWALVANFGGLLVAAMLAIFGFAFWSASENTIDLLRDRSEQNVTQLMLRVREHLDQPRSQLAVMAEQIADGHVSPEKPAEFAAFLRGGIAGVPQLRSIAYFGADLSARSVQRQNGALVPVDGTVGDDPEIIAMIRTAWASRQAGWVSPIFRPIFGQTVIGRGQPVIRNGQVIGVLTAVISIEELSAYVGRIGGELGGTGFILYGPDLVLAHGNAPNMKGRVSEKEPLLSVAKFGDPVLAGLWDERRRRARFFATRPPIQNRTLGIEGETYPVVYAELAGLSAKPLIVGAYVRASEFADIFNRLIFSMIAGFAAILGAIVMAVMLGQRLARPVRRFSEAAALITDLRVGEVKLLPPSRIRELDDQARAFNSMTGALRWFEAYVPKPLARHLLKEGDTRAVESEQRHLSVMFTDIVGFSTWSQERSASEVADHLNHHFSIVNGCIEAEDGIVDKYIGDCVMAFWGAPEKIKNRSERACRAALAIRDALERDNAACRARGDSETRIRIGIHSGDATVGNIGSPGRLNYTIIGDMVNAGQRIEQLAKELKLDDGAATILISETTRADLGPEFAPRSLGKHVLRGRDGEMEVFAL